MAKGTCLTCEHCMIGTERKNNLPISILEGNGDVAFDGAYEQIDSYTCTVLPMRLKVDKDYFCGQYVCDIARIQFQDDEEEETEVVNLTTNENLPEV